MPQDQGEDEDGMVVMDNLPWAVKTHFDFEDMICDMMESEFWFLKMIYPIMTFGLAICSAIFSIMINAINEN